MKKYCFLIFSLLLFSASTFAAQFAYIFAQKAVIYADAEMSAPIGYLPKGTKIRVGEVARNKGRVLPTVINGKIAYVKTDDIQSSLNSTVSSTSERIKENTKKKRHNRIELAGVIFNTTMENKTLLTRTSNGQSLLGKKEVEFEFQGVSFKRHLLRPKQKVTYRGELSYLVGSYQQIKVSMLNINLDIAVDALDTNFLDLRFYVGLAATPFSQLEVGSLFTKNGFGYGAYAGVDVAFHLGKKISIHLDGRYSKMALSSFKLPSGIDGKFSPTFTGPSFLAGISYTY